MRRSGKTAGGVLGVHSRRGIHTGRQGPFCLFVLCVLTGRGCLLASVPRWALDSGASGERLERGGKRATQEERFRPVHRYRMGTTPIRAAA